MEKLMLIDASLELNQLHFMHVYNPVQSRHATLIWVNIS